MKNRPLAIILQIGTILSVLFVLFIFLVYVPTIANEFREGAPEFSGYYWPMLLSFEAIGTACLIALAFFWRITLNISRNRTFTRSSQSCMRIIAGCATFAFLVLFIWAPFVPGFPEALLFLIGAFVAGIIAVACWALAYLVGQAARLQDDYDLTV